jgi:hypothetical protein
MRQRKVHFGAALVAAVFLVVSGAASPAPAQEGNGDADDYRHDLRFLC